MSKLLPPEIKTQVAYPGKKVSTCFNVKHQSKFEHHHYVVYYADGPHEKCIENYAGESGSRVSERIKHHNSRDLKYYIFRRIWTRERQL